jgi:hypothetical protein
MEADIRYVATDMTTSNTDEKSKAFARKWTEMTPFDRYVLRITRCVARLNSRFAEPKEIGDLAVLMCSERNTPWMTGSDVVIDGGESTSSKSGLRTDGQVTQHIRYVLYKRYCMQMTDVKTMTCGIQMSRTKQQRLGRNYHRPPF